MMNSTQSLNMYMQAMKVIRHISLLKFPGVLWIIIVSVFMGLSQDLNPRRTVYEGLVATYCAIRHSLWVVVFTAIKSNDVSIG